MESMQNNDPQTIKIQGLLDSYLAVRESKRAADSIDAGHLDEDTLSAFVESRISERESTPIVTHLVDCSFCRHVTAELIRLDAELAENEVITAQPASSEPSKVSEVLSGILERLFGSGEPAVFAHSDKEEEDKEDKEEKTKD